MPKAFKKTHLNKILWTDKTKISFCWNDGKRQVLRMEGTAYDLNCNFMPLAWMTARGSASGHTLSELDVNMLKLKLNWLISFTMLWYRFCNELNKLLSKETKTSSADIGALEPLVLANANAIFFFPASCTDAAAIFCGENCINEPQWLSADAEDAVSDTWTARYCARRAAP